VPKSDVLKKVFFPILPTNVIDILYKSSKKVLFKKDLVSATNAEARELRALQHRRIVGYIDDFVHTEWRPDEVAGAVALGVLHKSSRLS
jgi:hypothetical protein